MVGRQEGEGGGLGCRVLAKDFARSEKRSLPLGRQMFASRVDDSPSPNMMKSLALRTGGAHDFLSWGILEARVIASLADIFLLSVRPWSVRFV